MLSRPLLATLLALGFVGAPSGLWAFENMDCIGTEFCTDGGCAASAEVFTVDFDWTARAVAIARGNAPALMLAMVHPTGSGVASAGNLAFSQPDGDATLMLDVQADGIEAAVMFDDTGLYVGQCTAREAA